MIVRSWRGKASADPVGIAALIDYDRTVQHYEVVEDLAV